jgi:hypothetical protein
MVASTLSERQESRERIPAGRLCCAGGKVGERKVFGEMPLPVRVSRSAAGALARHTISMVNHCPCCMPQVNCEWS